MEYEVSLKKAVKEAKRLHESERMYLVESALLVGKLLELDAPGYYGVPQKEFAQQIGLTPNQFWKRAQAVRLLGQFPLLVEMIKKGELEFSHLALIATKLSEANQKLLLEKIRGKNKREIEAIVPRMTNDGRYEDG